MLTLETELLIVKILWLLEKSIKKRGFTMYRCLKCGYQKKNKASKEGNYDELSKSSQ
tara:strand:+ start:617 stop:787 length:171 start_codon:yes stop_codon:yes gene_type:complete